MGPAASGLPNLLGYPVPVLSLFGKQADVAEVGPLQLQGHEPVNDRPLQGRIAAHDPPALFGSEPFVPCVGREPELGSGRPDRFGGGAGPIEHQRSKTFQPPAIAEVQELILGGVEHGIAFYGVASSAQARG